ncbi:MAG: hypothetical protein LUD27_07340 [Clostridia bacterium]|nr:hypothetical protein [Clostridia bacterium]
MAIYGLINNGGIIPSSAGLRRQLPPQGEAKSTIVYRLKEKPRGSFDYAQDDSEEANVLTLDDVNALPFFHFKRQAAWQPAFL